MFLLRALPLLIGLAAASAIPVSPAIAKRGTGVCSGSDFVTPVSVGSTGGAPFCESSWGGSYAPVTSLDVFSNNNGVTGMQVTYSDKTTSAMLGGAGLYSKTVSVDYGTGDLWSRCSLYGVAGSSYVLHLVLNTTAGDQLNAGQGEANGNPNFVFQRQDVGSGILFGIQGTYGPEGDIQSLEFLFLGSTISTIAVNNVQFPDGPIGTNEGISPTDIGSAQYTNNSPDPIQYQFNNQIAETQAYQYSQTYTSTFTIQETITFNFGFNLIIVTGGSSATQFTWTNTQAYETQSTFTQATQVQYNAQVTVQPGQVIDCTAVMGEGAGTFPYTSTVTVTLANGNQYSFEESGLLTVTSFSQGQVSCVLGS